MMKHTCLAMWLALSMLALAVACGGPSEEEPPATAPQPEDLSKYDVPRGGDADGVAGAYQGEQEGYVSQLVLFADSRALLGRYHNLMGRWTGRRWSGAWRLEEGSVVFTYRNVMTGEQESESFLWRGGQLMEGHEPGEADQKLLALMRR